MSGGRVIFRYSAGSSSKPSRSASVGRFLRKLTKRVGTRFRDFRWFERAAGGITKDIPASLLRTLDGVESSALANEGSEASTKLGVASAVEHAPCFKAERTCDTGASASAGYRTMRADVAWTSYTALVDDTSVESGKIVVRKEGDAIELKIDFTAPYPRQIRIDGTKFESYKPRIQTIEEYDLAKHKDKLEQALLIGFGVSGKTIAKNYDAKILGDEDLDGVSTVHLELIPKSAEMRESVPKLEMWISTATWQPVQQKLHSASGGDYRLYSYSNAEINPSLKTSDFKLQISGKAKRIKPGS